jgi:hypothetical protein
MLSHTIGDFVKYGTKGERKNHFKRTIYKCHQIRRWHEKNKERSEKSALLLNLLSAVADYLEVANDCFDKHISILAMATRNQYELNLRIKSLIRDEEEMKIWNSEAITDGIQAHEGFLNLHETPNPSTAIVKEEIDRLERLRKKWGLPLIKNSMPTGNLARKIGIEDDHNSFFKLYSKLVHPSSYLVNNQEYCTENFFQILEIKIQQYAFDSIFKVCEALEIPSKKYM